MKRTLAAFVLLTVSLGLHPAQARPGILSKDAPLSTRVHTTDVAFRDYGAVAARKASGVRGRDVGICVVDTGVDTTHEQLDSQGDMAGRWLDVIAGRPLPYDDHGHGTHVASIALGDGVGTAKYRGVAPKAILYAAKVLDAGGSGTFAQVIGGIDWCARQPGVSIISMSLGTSQPSDGTDPLSEAVNRAAAAGQIVVVAAGNAGPLWNTIGSPGAAAGAITVGAAAEWSGKPKAPNWSGGPFLDGFSSRGGYLTQAKPDLVGPGDTITSAAAGTVTGYVTFSGTSMATPYVAGTAALMLSAGVLSADVRAVLCSTALDLGPLGNDPDWGCGLVDTLAAVSGQQAVSFPPHELIEATFDSFESQYVVHRFAVDDLAQPIAATAFVSTDLDLILVDPTGQVLDVSFCGTVSRTSRKCGRFQQGRQETISAVPTVAGIYELYVVTNVLSDTPKQGTIAVELFSR